MGDVPAELGMTAPGGGWGRLLRQDISLAQLIRVRFGQPPAFRLLVQGPWVAGRCGARVSCYLLSEGPVSLHLVRLNPGQAPGHLLGELARGRPLGECLESHGWARRGLTVRWVSRLPRALGRYLSQRERAFWLPGWVRHFWVGEGENPVASVWEMLPGCLWNEE